MGVLADKLDRAASRQTDSEPGQLDALLAGAAFTEDGTLSLTNGAQLAYTMRLVPTAAKGQIVVERDKHFAAQGIERTVYNADVFEHDAVLRKLAYAVCKRGTNEPLDTYAEWCRLANDAVVGPLWQHYCDLETKLDPRDEILATEVYERIVAHIKKNGAASFGWLTTFGSRALANFAITSVGRHSSSPDHRSCGGGSTGASLTTSGGREPRDAIENPEVGPGAA